jgi:hypothetical protein
MQKLHLKVLDLQSPATPGEDRAQTRCQTIDSGPQTYEARANWLFTLSAVMGPKVP